MRLAAFVIAILLASSALAALNAGLAWDVRTTATASNINGGAFRNADNVATPSAPSVSCPTTGGTVAANTYYVVVVYVSAFGREGPASAATSVVCTGSTSSIVTTSPAASGVGVSTAVNYHVYIGTANLPGPWFANPGTDVAIGTNSTRTTTPATSGTNPPGADLSQSNGSTKSYTDIIVGGTTTTATSVARPFVPADVGNLINVASGCTVQTVEITAVSATNVATFDKSLGTAASTCVGELGGAKLTLSATELLAVAGNRINVKSGTYTETLTMTISGGAGTPRNWDGYLSSHLDAPSGTDRPLIDATSLTNGVAVVATTGNAFSYLRIANATGANVTGTTGGSLWYRCKSSGAAGDGFAETTSGNLTLDECESASNSGYGVSASGTQLVVIGSYIHDNTLAGVLSTSVGSLFMCHDIVEMNAASNVSIASPTVAIVTNSTIDGASGGTSDGIQLGTSSTGRFTVLADNAITNSGRYGVNRTAQTSGGYGVVDYDGYYGNSTAARNNAPSGSADLSTNPAYTNATGGDFSIGTAGWKTGGSPGAFPGGASTGYMAIGAVGPQCSGGGGLIIPPGLNGGIQ